jgi:hypothetical protein
VGGGQHLADAEAEDGVAQELEALVVRHARLVREAGVCERLFEAVEGAGAHQGLEAGPELGPFGGEAFGFVHP